MKKRQDGQIFETGDIVSVTSDRTGRSFDQGIITDFFMNEGVTVHVRGGWIIDTWLNKIEHVV